MPRRALLPVVLLALAACDPGPPVVVERYRTAGDLTTGTVRNESGRTLRDLRVYFEPVGYAVVGTVADGATAEFEAVTLGQGEPRPVRVTWEGGELELPASEDRARP